MTTPLLRLRGVGRHYDSGPTRVDALAGIDLDIHAGEFVAVTGPSGGGKSTLLAILGLLDAPDEGEYLVLGHDTGRMSPAEATALRARLFGFVFQSFHLLEHRPARDSAELAAFYQGRPARARHRAATDALRAVGLEGREHAPARTLSGGQRQRVAIARAVAGATPVLLADEPTGNLDSRTGERVLEQLDALHRAGATVVLVTHSPVLAARATRVIRITDGRITDDRVRDPARRGPAPDPLIPAVTTEPTRVRAVDALVDAVRSLRSRPREVGSLVVAVAVAVAMLVVTFGLATSTRAQVSGTFDERANREVTVTWQSSSTPLSLREAVDRLVSAGDIEAIAAVADHGEVAVGAAGETRASTLHGAEAEVAAATRSEIAWMPGESGRLDRGEALVGASLAEQLQLAPLSHSPTVTAGGRLFGVVGVIERSDRLPRLAGELVLGAEDARSLKEPGSVTLAVVASAGAAQQVGERAAAALDPFAPDTFVVEVPQDPRDLRQEIEGGVQTALFAFSGLATAVAAVTLSSAVGASVRQRRVEFGLRRAVGAQGRHLAALVALEGLAVGVLGAAAGLVVGVATILGFTVGQQWIPVVDPAVIPVAVGGGVALSAVGSVRGAVRAARVRPAEALRS